MKLSTQTDAFSLHFGEKNAIRMLIQSGYDALDCSCFDMLGDDSPKMQPSYRTYAKHLRRIAEDGGVYFNQAHAPFPSSRSDEAFTKDVFRRIVRAMEFAALYCGAPQTASKIFHRNSRGFKAGKFRIL